MKNVARVLVGILGLMLLLNGLAYMFVPEVQLASTMIEPTGDGIFGMSNVRANIGAPMVTFAILLAISAIQMRKEPLGVMIIFFVLAIVARIAGLAVAGVDGDFFSVRITVLLSVMLAICAFGYRTFQQNES